MRLRNVKNKEEILSSSSFLVKDPKNYCGNWSNYFDNSNPIYIEIGMGKGQFIRENARRYPDINFIGIEKYDSVVAKCLPKIDENLKNLAIVRMDALNGIICVDFLVEFFWRNMKIFFVRIQIYV